MCLPTFGPQDFMSYDDRQKMVKMTGDNRWRGKDDAAIGAAFEHARNMKRDAEADMAERRLAPDAADVAKKATGVSGHFARESVATAFPQLLRPQRPTTSALGTVMGKPMGKASQVGTRRNPYEVG